MTIYEKALKRVCDDDTVVWITDDRIKIDYEKMEQIAQALGTGKYKRKSPEPVICDE